MFKKRWTSATKKKLEPDAELSSPADWEQLEKLDDVRLLQSSRIINKGIVLEHPDSRNEEHHNDPSTATKGPDDPRTMTLKRAFREQIDGSGEETRKHMEEYIQRKLREEESDIPSVDMVDNDSPKVAISNDQHQNSKDAAPTHAPSELYTVKSSEYRPVFQGISGLSEVPLGTSERLKIAEEVEAIRTGLSKPKRNVQPTRRRG